jgi:hypothetical protein
VRVGGRSTFVHQNGITPFQYHVLGKRPIPGGGLRPRLMGELSSFKTLGRYTHM